MPGCACCATTSSFTKAALKTLKRFKDEVREVNQGYECGMAFENYQDIQAGDVIECFEVEEVARAL